MAEITLDGVSKVFPDGTSAVTDLDLKITDREFVVLVGPSGCGKSTTLRMVAGLEEITEGEIWIGERVVNDVPPKDRDIAMVFQNYALYPHMTVYKNMAFGFKLRKYPEGRDPASASKAAADPRHRDLLNRKPKALSGGQRQRVAVGRAIVRGAARPSSSTSRSRTWTPSCACDARGDHRCTAARVDDDLRHPRSGRGDDDGRPDRGDEAGRRAAGGPSAEFYNVPVNKFVAGFIGAPAMNLVEGQLEQANGQYSVAFGEYRLTVDERAAPGTARG